MVKIIKIHQYILIKIIKIHDQINKNQENKEKSEYMTKYVKQ